MFIFILFTLSLLLTIAVLIGVDGRSMLDRVLVLFDLSRMSLAIPFLLFPHFSRVQELPCTLGILKGKMVIRCQGARSFLHSVTDQRL